MISSLKFNKRYVFSAVLLLSGGFFTPFLSFKSAVFVYDRFGGSENVSQVKNAVTAHEVENIAVREEQPEDSGGEVIPNSSSTESAYLYKNKISFPKITAASYLVADLDSGAIIREKNKNKAMPIASLSKLMTALVSLEEINQTETVKISGKAVSTYGAGGSLRKNEGMTVENLLYPLLLESSNDAAIAFAEYLGEEKFIGLMNDTAFSVGLVNTVFTDSSGISPKNVSTAEDLFRLVQYIYRSKNQIFEITQKQEFALNGKDGKITHIWHNNNALARNKKYYLGGKNGYTSEAGKTLVALFSLPIAESGKRNIAIILLDSVNNEYDAFSIANWLNADVVYSEDFILSEKNLSLFFVGDIMFGRGVENSVLKNNNGDFSFIFKNAGFLKDADITFGNLEGPISDKGDDLKNLYSFRFEPSSAPALKDAGFDVLSVANNHVGDYGRGAFEDTLVRLANENILAIGGGMNKEDATEVKIIEKNGLKVGLLGFSDVGPNELEASRDSSGILIADEKTLPLIVRKAAAKADILAVSFHFGEEYRESANNRQKKLARLAIDSGARIVIGHHPHVVEELEYYKKGIIAYSLGNFVFDQNFSEKTMSGLALDIIIKGKEIISVKQHPIKINSFFQPELAD